MNQSHNHDDQSLAMPHSQDEVLLEMIKQAQEGSGEAYQMVRGQYRPLIESSVTRYASPDMSKQDVADLHEEAERMFLNALITYDTEQTGVDFGLYAKICLRNGLISEIRRLNNRKRFGVVSLDSNDLFTIEDPAGDVAEEERFRYLYVKIHEHLSEMENKVWWMYVSGVGVKAIAEKIQKDEKSVHNAIYRIRRKLRTLLATDV